MQVSGMINQTGEIRVFVIDPLRQAVAMFNEFAGE
jgi:hypothetical protein